MKNLIKILLIILGLSLFFTFFVHTYYSYPGFVTEEDAEEFYKNKKNCVGIEINLGNQRFPDSESKSLCIGLIKKSIPISSNQFSINNSNTDCKINSDCRIITDYIEPIIMTNFIDPAESTPGYKNVSCKSLKYELIDGIDFIEEYADYFEATCVCIKETCQF